MDLILALRWMDPAAIRRAMRRRGCQPPDDDFVLIAGSHKSRLLLPEFTDAERQESRQWLAAHGLKPFRGLIVLPDRVTPGGN